MSVVVHLDTKIDDKKNHHRDIQINIGDVKKVHQLRVRKLENPDEKVHYLQTKNASQKILNVHQASQQW